VLAGTRCSRENTVLAGHGGSREHGARGNTVLAGHGARGKHGARETRARRKTRCARRETVFCSRKTRARGNTVIAGTGARGNTVLAGTRCSRGNTVASGETGARGTRLLAGTRCSRTEHGARGNTVLAERGAAMCAPVACTNTRPPTPATPRRDRPRSSSGESCGATQPRLPPVYLTAGRWP